MLVVGLTGGIGSGKTTVANLFAAKGITVIDTDQLARDVTQPGQPALKEIIEKFGTTILLPDGTLNRAKLREKVFANQDDRIWLEKLLHPLIRVALKKQIESAEPPYCIVVIPLLFETEKNPLINRIVVVDTPKEEQIKRIKKRDNLTEEEITAILNAQTTREKRLRGADDIIVNQGSREDLSAQVETLHLLFSARM